MLVCFVKAAGTESRLGRCPRGERLLAEKRGEQTVYGKIPADDGRKSQNEKGYECMVYRGNEPDTGEMRLPRNIRQIGESAGDTRVYLEDYAVTYLHQIKAAVLLGEIRQNGRFTCYFVSGAIEVKDIGFPDEIWEPVFQEAKEYFDGREIIGWYGRTSLETWKIPEEMERIYYRYFREQDPVLVLYDEDEEEEAVFLAENGTLVKQRGFYIYYDKNKMMQDYMVWKNTGKSVEKEMQVSDSAIRSFRRIIEKKSVQKGQRRETEMPAAAMDGKTEEKNGVTLPGAFDGAEIRLPGAGEKEESRQLSAGENPGGREKQRGQSLPGNKVIEAAQAAADEAEEREESGETGSWRDIVQAAKAREGTKKQKTAEEESGKPAAMAGEERAEGKRFGEKLKALYKKESTQGEPQKKGNGAPNTGRLVYGAGAFLMLSVLAIGITVIQNYDKMRSMEEAMQETQSGQVSIQVSAPAGNLETEAESQSGISLEIQETDSAAGADNAAAGETQALDTISNEMLPSGDAISDDQSAETNAGAESGGTLSEGQSVGASAGAAAADEAASDEQSAEANAGTAADGTLADGQAADETGSADSREAASHAIRAEYVIKEGDTLADVCEMYYGSLDMIERICEENGIEDPNQILPGQKIVLP